MTTLNTFTGHKDTDQLVTNKLSDRDLLNFCVANPNMTICKDDNFWRGRLFKKYGVITKSADRSWKTFYLQTVYYLDKNVNSANTAMELSARGGHRDLVSFFIKKGANYWNWGMGGAAKGGHRDLVDFFIQQGANRWDFGMYYAAKGGHRDLVSFFIQQGANDWNWGMHGAKEGGHRELVEFFQQKMN